MWWLHFVDGPLPVGDITYWGGVGVVGVFVINCAINSTSSSVSTNTSSKSTTKTKDFGQTAVAPDTPSTPTIPDVKYPGDDPNIAPEGTEWRGKGSPGDGRIEPRAFANTWSLGDTIEIF